MDDPASFGRWLRKRRGARDTSREALARRVGCAVVTIKKIETGERRPSRQIAELILEALAVPVEERSAVVRLARAPSHSVSPEAHIPPLTPADLALEDLTGRAIRGYALHDRLGAGGFGVVYRAEQPVVGRAVAIKIVLPQFADQPEFIRRFAAEAQIIARLEHPHIVPLYDFWREPGGAYLVMRYVPGGTLLTLLQRGPLALDISARLLDQIGAALAFAHRAGVVHRDIKPSNVLLDDDGNAYLADFGIAKDLSNAELADQTQPGAILGSPAYLSPEQIKDEPITPRSDIYSLGVMLYELLTGAKPFQAPTPGELIQKQLNEPTPAMHERRPDFPATLDEVILRATAKRPADRYPDVSSLVADFHAVVSSPLSVVRGNRSREAAQRATDDEHQRAILDLQDLENPYKGLRAFGEADASNFFGRTALVARLLERMAEESVARGPWPVAGTDQPHTADNGQRTTDNGRFLAVVGPSGSGKSSVVRAGLIPALRRGGLPGSERWYIAEMLPGAHPLEELELALLRLAAARPANLAEQLARDERGLLRAIRLVLPPDGEGELVLVIDQFEEIFTLVEDEATRAHFLGSLVAAVTDERSRARVVITLRADFYDRPLLYPDLGELVRARTEVVLPLTPDEIEQAIASPAARAGLAIEPRLTAEIVNDVGEQPGALPLLQYALTELFERRDGRTLTRAAYQASGGVRGALARRADVIYATLDSAGQAAARQLFLRLITLGEGIEDTRRRTPRAELTALTSNHSQNQERAPAGATENQSNEAGSWFLVLGSPTAMDAVIDAYGRARLLSFDRDPITRAPTVEVAHEALLREWGQLRAWLDASRADVRMQRLLAAGAAEWSAAGRDPSYLLGGGRLAQFEGWAAQTELALTQDERAFLEAGLAGRAERVAAEQERQARELAQERATARAQRSAAQRLRSLVGALAIFLFAAIGLSTFAFQQRGEADQQRSAAEANAAVADQQRRAAEANAAEAERQRGEAQANLMRAEAQRLAGEASRLVAQQGNIDLATLLAIRSVHTRRTPQGEEAIDSVLQLPYPERVLTDQAGEGIRRVRFSPDGRYLLLGGADGSVQLWDAQTGKQLRSFLGLSKVYDVNFSPDGTLIAAAGLDGAYVIPLAGDAHPMQLPAGQGVWGVAFLPDGRFVLTAGGATAALWDLQTGQEIRRFAAPAAHIQTLAVSPDGRTFATGDGIGGAGAVRLWDAQTGDLVRTLTGHTLVLRQLAFSPDGTRLLSAAIDSTARLWNVATGAELLRITAHTGYVQCVAFAPDGRTFLTGSSDRTIRLWDTATGTELRRLNAHTDEVYDVTFSSDRQLAASASLDGTIRLWRIQETPGLPRFVGHSGPVGAAAFTPDGQTLVTGSEDSTVRVWNTATGAEQKILDGHSAIGGVALSPDGRLLVGTGGDFNAHLWHMPSGEPITALPTTDNVALWQVAISQDGRYLATIGWSGPDVGATVWDLRTHKQVALFGQINGRSVAFSPDSRLLLTGAQDGYARLWDVEKRDFFASKAFHVDGTEAMSVAFAPDGQAIATGSDYGVVQLWDLTTRKEPRRFVGHNAPVRSVVFSRDGKHLLTASEDQTARLWDVQTGAELRRFVGHRGGVLIAIFSPDGRYVLTGSGDRTARLWYTNLDDAVSALCGRLQRDFTAEERAQYGITDNAPTCPKP